MTKALIQTDRTKVQIMLPGNESVADKMTSRTISLVNAN